MTASVQHTAGCLCLCLCLGATAAVASDGPTPHGVPDPHRFVQHLSGKSADPARAFADLPVGFERNDGQVENRVRYMARFPGFSLYIGDEALALVLPTAWERDRAPSDAVRRMAATANLARVMHLRFVGASPVSRVEGMDPMPGVSHYLTGNDPSRWRTNVARFAAVRRARLYPGIDAVFYASAQRFEYDFVLEPGADPSAIALAFNATARLRVDDCGDLHVSGEDFDIVQSRPVAYQTIGEIRRPIPARYALRADGAATIHVGEYDHNLPLVIDPAIGYSTYFGGSGGDNGRGIAVDAAGFAYVTGDTGSPDFFLMNPIRDQIEFEPDAFVSKFAPGGQDLLYSTFIGGDDVDFPASIAVDTTGAAYIAGTTNSSNFPTPNGFQKTLGGGGIDAFVCKINAAGSAIVYGSYLGGGDFDIGRGIAVDRSGAASVTGETKSTDFPTRNAFQTAIGSSDRLSDAFVARFAPSGSSLVFSSYLGGRDQDYAQGVAVDGGGATYVAGYTLSPNFPKLNPIRGTQIGGEAFATKINPAVNGMLVYSTLLGGSNRDEASAIAVTQTGVAIVTGRTASADMPVVGATQPEYGGGAGDAFVAAIAATGTGLLYSTFLGGSGVDRGLGVAVDETNGAYVTGATDSEDFPRVRAIQDAIGGGSDVFVASYSASGATIEFASVLGGSGEDIGTAIAVDPSANIYLTGSTRSTDFPQFLFFQPGGLAGGGVDAFVTKIVGVFDISWEPPDPDSTDNAPPPRFPSARRVDRGPQPGAVQTAVGARRANLTMYKVYRSIFPNVQPVAGNLFTSTPPNQTNSGGTAPGGAFFVITACYDDGTESAPSGEVSGGANEPIIESVKATNKLTITGSRLSSPVQVYLDGIPFTAAAKLKKNNTRVVQKGALITGQSISQYIASKGGRVQVQVRNGSGGISGFTLIP